MLTFGVIGFLVLFLIYFVLPIQTLQQEGTALRSCSENQTKRANHKLEGLTKLVLCL